MGQKPKLFIGLVTHPKSRFNARGKASRRITELAQNLRENGITVETLVSDRNDFDENPQKIGFGIRLRSAWLQAELERAWAKYLDSVSDPKTVVRHPGRFFYLAMFIKRSISFLASARSLERLANIDLSHLRVLRAGINSGADWILVLEDDGVVENLSEVAANLEATISFAETDKSDTFMNLSQSMSEGELGIEAIMSRAKEVFSFPDGGKIVQISTPISNTVCANLYSRTFAARFADAIESLGILPSIPIDWRLNKLVMNSTMTDTRCYWVIPGMFIQESMHPNETGRQKGLGRSEWI